MKKCLLTFSLLLVLSLIVTTDAQNPSTTDPNVIANTVKPPMKTMRDSSILEEYCSVIARGRLLSEEVTIAIDYGDNPNNRKRLRDKKGDVLKFTSVIDALNYVGEAGWRLVNAFNINGTANTAPQYTYIFKREYFGKRMKDQ